MAGDPQDIRIGAPVGEDALGMWHRAEAPDGARALRRLRAELRDREDARLLFAEEVRRIATLDHPALVRVHAHGARAPWPWMLTDPVDGPTLEAWPDTASPEEALTIVRHLLGGLEALAARRQFHAAPVPGRIVRVGHDWRWLTFRSVRAWDEARALKGRPFADPPRAPPEIAADHPEPVRVGPFLAWGLGSVLRHLLAGAPSRGPASRSASPPAVDAHRVLSSLADPDPGRRPAALEAIRRLLAPDAPAAVRDDPPRPAPIRRRRRRR